MSKNREKMWIPEIRSENLTLEKPDIEIELSMGSLAGFVQIDLIDAVTGVVKEHYEFPNTILTAGLDGMISDLTLLTLMQNLNIGTGSTTVTPSDLGLDEEVAITANNGGIGDVFGFQSGTGGGQFDLGNPFHFIKRTRVFVENEANFPTLSELGFRHLGSPDFQFTRTLIKDVTGSPITIEKTDQDQLRITYEIRGFPPTGHLTSSFVFLDSETSHSVTASGIEISDPGAGSEWGFSQFFSSKGFFRIMGGAGAFGGDGWGAGNILAFGSASVPKNPTGTIADWGWVVASQKSGVSQSLFQPYVSGTFARTKLAVWEPSEVLFGSGGIQGMTIQFSAVAPFAMYFTPSIKKTELQRLSLAYRITVTASVTSSA